MLVTVKVTVTWERDCASPLAASDRGWIFGCALGMAEGSFCSDNIRIYNDNINDSDLVIIVTDI